jgi:hypothetical protein
MNCRTAREAIIDERAGALDAHTAAALHRHLETCAACAAEARPTARLWTELGGLAAPVIGDAAIERVSAALARAAGAGVPHPAELRARSIRARIAGWAAAALAAGLLLGFLAGNGVRAPGPTAPPAPPGPVAAPAPADLPADAPRFLLLLLEPIGVGATAPDDDRVAEYAAWARSLRQRGRLVAAEKLADSPATWIGPPAEPAGERVAGFFLLRAATYEEALRLANESPHVKHAGRVELRRIEET